MCQGMRRRYIDGHVDRAVELCKLCRSHVVSTASGRSARGVRERFVQSKPGRDRCEHYTASSEASSIARLHVPEDDIDATVVFDQWVGSPEPVVRAQGYIGSYKF